MKKKLLLTVAVVVALLTVHLSLSKLLLRNINAFIQLTNYKGDGAYIVASLINPQGKYEQTLQVLGDDPEWYDDLTEWWKFYGKRQTIDGITGETISGGRTRCKSAHP